MCDCVCLSTRPAMGGSGFVYLSCVFSPYHRGDMSATIASGPRECDPTGSAAPSGTVRCSAHPS